MDNDSNCKEVISDISKSENLLNDLKKNTTKSKYTLQVGKDGEERLDILNELYNPLSQNFIKKLGINERKNILDVACGTGEMSCWIAQQTTGEVVAIDISQEQLDIARKKASFLGIKNIRFIKLSVFNLEKLSKLFDFIYCRFLLVHIQNPEMAIKSMYDRLAEDGVVACEEATASVSFCYPESPYFNKWLNLWSVLRRSNGTDLDLGLKLPHLFKTIGCMDIKTNLVQPVLLTPKHKSILRLNVIETMKSAIDAKFDTETGIKQLIKDLSNLEKEDHLIGYVRNSQVSGYKKYGLFNYNESQQDSKNKETPASLKLKN